VVGVVTRGERRRRWSDEDRARILTEAMAPGAIASHVARRFVVSKVVRTSGSIRKYGIRASAIRTTPHFRYSKFAQFQ
jgi:transposase-like protein